MEIILEDTPQDDERIVRLETDEQRERRERDEAMGQSLARWARGEGEKDEDGS